MYAYYTISAIGFKIPTIFSLVLTTLQLTQMLIGIALSTITIYFCDNVKNQSSAYFGLFIYFTYAVLFAIFLVNSFKKKIK